MWEIDSDGDAYNDKTDEFISCGKIGAGFAIFKTTGKKGFKVLGFTMGETQARYKIWQIIMKLNAEERNHDQTRTDS